MKTKLNDQTTTKTTNYIKLPKEQIINECIDK